MSKVVIIGAGGVGRVTAYKCAQNKDVFTEIILASRTKSKCDDIARDILRHYGQEITTEQVDADDVDKVVAIFKKHHPKIVINVALPYQDLTIMDACLKTRVHYLDTANYEPPEEAKFEYKWQWAYQDKFREAGLLAVLGCGFDPGVTGVFTSRAAKHHFDEIHHLDIVDCNAGDHGQAFATNFNPEINIREIIQNGKYWENGRWVETKPFEFRKDLDYPNIGRRPSYLLYHEELESLVKNYPSLKRARFWMTFGDEYLTHLRVIKNIGMSSIEPIIYEGKKIIPLQFLKAVLPNPGALGNNYKGETSIGCRIKGIKGGKEKTYYIWNNCSHKAAFEETGAQGVSYTTGVPAMVGAYMMMTNKWSGAGVFNVEQFDSDPFLEKLATSGLIWQEKHNIDLEMD
ncbi:MAG: saccharopine dehydrogenase family protein [Bacteroidota bacterium]